MAKNREYKSHHPENPPDWYWINGLHDAGIVEVETFAFPFAYNKFVGEKSNYNRNLLILRINARGALYDASVQEIHFYNYICWNIYMQDLKLLLCFYLLLLKKQLFF